MNDPMIQVTERLYVEEPGRPRYVLAHPGQSVRRSVLEKHGYSVPEADAKRRPRKTVEDKAIKPEQKAKDEA